MSDATHPDAVDVGGTPYLRDAKGSLVPIASIKAADLLMDETVRGILDNAKRVASVRFGTHSWKIEAWRLSAFASDDA